MDARRLQDRPPGGVARALQSVVEHLAAEVDLTLLVDATREPVPTDLPAARALPSARCTGDRVAPVERRTVAAELRRDLPRDLQRAAVPVRRPSVVTIHDLSFEIHPEGMSRRAAVGLQAQARHAAKIAGRIVTPSEHDATS